MNRISFRKKVSAPAHVAAPVSTIGSLREAPPTPGGDSWVVNEELLVERAKLVPSNPQGLSPEARSKFLQMTFADRQWADLDYCQYGLGVALGVFAEGVSFQHLKWIFWTENVVGASLNELVLALAKPESNCLQTRNEPDFQLAPIV